MANITVYTTPSCPYCQMVKSFLEERDVEFEEIDVSMDRESAKKMVQKSGQMGVPQTEINDKIIVGFDKQALEEEIQNLE